MVADQVSETRVSSQDWVSLERAVAIFSLDSSGTPGWTVLTAESFLLASDPAWVWRDLGLLLLALESHSWQQLQWLVGSTDHRQRRLVLIP